MALLLLEGEPPEDVQLRGWRESQTRLGWGETSWSLQSLHETFSHDLGPFQLGCWELQCKMT